MLRYAEFLWEVGAIAKRGFRVPSFKLTMNNALKHPDARRRDKQNGVPKAFRQYQQRYAP